MSDLTPAQRIEAAIVRLEGMRDAEAVRGHLLFTYYAGANPSPFDALTLVLHATIDAQLGLLKGARGGASDLTRGAYPDEPSSTYEVLALADAIISGGTE